MKTDIAISKAQKTAQLLLSIEAMSFRFDPPFTYTSGLKSPIYLDNRLVLSHPEVRAQIIDLYVQIIAEVIGLEHVECVSGTATAAIPQAAWIADHLAVPMVYVRSSAKEHGKGQKMEGVLKKGAKVLIVEDHLSTGGSALDNAKTIRKAGGEVKYCIATTSYETEISKRAFAANKVTPVVLTSGITIVDEAGKQGIITAEEVESARRWFADPEAWANK